MVETRSSVLLHRWQSPIDPVSFVQQRRLHRKLRNRELLAQLDATTDPAFMEVLAWTEHPCEEIAQAWQLRLDRMFLAKANEPLNQSRITPSFACPIAIGKAPDGAVVSLERDEGTRHVLVAGGTGGGKTNLLFSAIRQYLAQGVRIIFLDLKNEGRRLIQMFPETALFTVDQLRVNFLDPQGAAPETYLLAVATELARALNLRPEATNKLVEVLIRTHAGLGPREPFPSLTEVTNLLYSLSTEKSASVSYRTIASALQAICSTLGKLATVRQGPAIESIAPLVIIEAQGIPPRIQQLLSALMLIRDQAHGRAAGHQTNKLRLLRISDEGELEYHRSLQESGSYISPQDRMVTQL